MIARDEGDFDAASSWKMRPIAKRGLPIRPTGTWPANHGYATVDLSI